jgi:hypothetical protein
MNYANSNQTVASAPSTPIQTAMSQLSIAIRELGETADMMVSRVSGLMTPSMPAPTSGSTGLAAAQPPSSMMQDELSEYRRRVDNIAAQVRDALNRLEV